MSLDERLAGLLAFDSEDFIELARVAGLDLRTDLRGADLRGLSFRGADLRGCDLRDTDLGECDLRGANLTGARLSRANLERADLTSAVLRAADLYDANITGAVLTGADLGRANSRRGDMVSRWLAAPQPGRMAAEGSAGTGDSRYLGGPRRASGAAAIVAAPGGRRKREEDIAAEPLRVELPAFRPGDTVRVNVRVVEGGIERIRPFEGVCIARKHGGSEETFKVRRISGGVGVERTFPLHASLVESIEIVRQGRVVRTKLYYLRALRGKAAREKERRMGRHK